MLKNDGRNKRRRWLTNKLTGVTCLCGESQPHHLMFYPHHRKIRYLNLRFGLKHPQRMVINKLMDDSEILCWHCALDKKEDLSAWINY